MKLIHHISLVIALGITLCFIGDALAQPAQTQNPLYMQASHLWGKVSNAPLSNEIKAPLGKRFGDLSREQRRLWAMAHQVDSGTCVNGCITAYNDGVEQWQWQLQQFNTDASNALLMPPSGNPTGMPPGNPGGLPPSRGPGTMVPAH